MYGLGTDDLVFMIISLLGLLIFNRGLFYLTKIYRRAKQIAKLQEHYFIDHMKEAHDEEVYFD